MIACVDVDYGDIQAVAACLLFRNWPDEHPSLELRERVEQTAAYEPGRFYRRELPALLSILHKLPANPEAIIVDGYVWLGQVTQPGLGAYLFDALDRTTAVIGVAKTRFKEGPAVRAICRGTSIRPLYVTAIGMDLNQAADRILEMHGDFRIPTLLRNVDRLCRRLYFPQT
jgi:deoxyribonuclease V